MVTCDETTPRTTQLLPGSPHRVPLSPISATGSADENGSSLASIRATIHSLHRYQHLLLSPIDGELVHRLVAPQSEGNSASVRAHVRKIDNCIEALSVYIKSDEPNKQEASQLLEMASRLRERAAVQLGAPPSPTANSAPISVQRTDDHIVGLQAGSNSPGVGDNMQTSQCFYCDELKVEMERLTKSHACIDASITRSFERKITDLNSQLQEANRRVASLESELRQRDRQLEEMVTEHDRDIVDIRQSIDFEHRKSINAIPLPPRVDITQRDKTDCVECAVLKDRLKKARHQWKQISKHFREVPALLDSMINRTDAMVTGIVSAEPRVEPRGV